MDEIEIQTIQQVTELRTENKHLKERVKYLEQLNTTLVEGIFRNNNQQYPSPIQTKPYAGCSVCGLKFDGVMGYVCTRSDCPTAVRC